MKNVPKDLLYSTFFTIRTYEIDRQKKATVTTLVNLMQEAAMQNVIELKVSLWDLQDTGVSWVLMRKNLQVSRLPNLGETIRIVTHPSGFERIYTHRDYLVFDEKDQLIAQSSSTWLLMNMHKRRVARIPEAIREKGQFDTSGCLPRAKAKLATLTAVDCEKAFEVQWHDLDFNEHLNNVRYMQWLFETVDYYVQHKGALVSMDILYKAECAWKEVVVVQTQAHAEGNYLHRLMRQSDGAIIAEAQTTWRAF